MSDLSTTSWTEVDASNNQQPPEGWPTGMAPNQVEPSARMNMAAVKRFWNRVNPVYLATLTTTDTFAVTETQALVGYGLNERRATRFPNANVSTSVTINHSALGAQFFKKWNNAGALVNIASGDIQAQEHEYYWDGSEMVLLNPASVGLSLTAKASPTTSDSMVISDAAASNVQKLALLSGIPNIYPTKATPTSSDSVLLSDGGAAGVGKSALLSNVLKQPTRTVLTSGSGTYNTPAGAVRLGVRMVGGGGGGAGSGTTAGNGGNTGTNTTFGAALLAANGGAVGTTTNGGAGGTASGGDINLTGGAGGLPTGLANQFGGAGGSAAWPGGGGGIGGSQTPSAGSAGGTNTGGGGGGAGDAGTINSGGGGGAGGYCEKLINGPAASYAYAVGAAGAAGTAGTGGAAGGAGGSGLIDIIEYYY